jgi:hypothetical protein
VRFPAATDTRQTPSNDRNCGAQLAELLIEALCLLAAAAKPRHF